MKSIFEKIKEFTKQHSDDIILVIGVILISLLSFAAGFITAKIQEKEPIRIEKIQNYGSKTSSTTFRYYY